MSFRFVFRLLVSPLLVSQIFAAEESPWEFTGAAGLSYAGGNSDTLAFSLQFLASYMKDSERGYIGADYFYAEDGSLRSTDSTKVFGQYNHDLGTRFYLGAYSSYLQDQVAGLDYRADVNLLLGYRAVDRDNMSLSFDAGPGYVWEEQDFVRKERATLRFAERFEYHFNGKTKFWQSLGFTPVVDDFADYLLDLEMGIQTRITDQWSLRSFLRQRIDSTPSEGNGRTDTALMFGVAYDLGGLPEPKAADGRRSLMPGAEAEAEKSKGWESTAALGFSLNQGNSDSLGFDLAWNSAFRSSNCECFFDLAHTYAENHGETAGDRTSSRVQSNHFLGKRPYLGVMLGFLRDSEADIEYRVTPALLAGYAFVKTESTRWVFEAGPSYTFESVGEQSDGFVSGVAAERFSHRFNERFSVNQSVVYSSELADFQRYTLTTALGLDTKLNDRLIWRLAASYSYENQPAAGRQQDDSALTSSIALKF